MHCLPCIVIDPLVMIIFSTKVINRTLSFSFKGSNFIRPCHATFAFETIVASLFSSSSTLFEVNITYLMINNGYIPTEDFFERSLISVHIKTETPSVEIRSSIGKDRMTVALSSLLTSSKVKQREKTGSSNTSRSSELEVALEMESS